MSIKLYSKWSHIPAIAFCDSVRDGTHDSPKLLDSGYPLITSKSLKMGMVNLETSNLISKADFEEINRRSKVDQWDVLFSMIGTVGEVSLVKEEEPGYAIKNIGLFKCKNEIKAKWLFYWFVNPQTKTSIKQVLRGSSQQYIPLGELRQLPISMPSEPRIMRRVVDILSTYDDLIENNRRRMGLLEDAARQVYQEWFVRLRFPGCEHTRIVDGVPEGWQRKTLGNCVTLNYGKALKADTRIDGPFPVYGSSGIVGRHEKALVEGPGIIVGRKGNVGSIFWSSKNFYPIDTVYFISAESSNLYLYYALKGMHFISTDVAVPGLNRNFAYSRQLLIPAKSIMRSFLEVVTPMQEQSEKLEEMNQKLRTARDLLLPKLMSGELTV